jgi:mRNA interferase MazF
MVIRQGEVYWVELGEPRGSGPGYRHPHVVVQNNAINRSAIRTVLVCPLTSNVRRASAIGNVLLRKKEAKLPKPSVVNVSQLIAVDKRQLGELIGTLSAQRVREIVDGIHLVIEPMEPPRQRTSPMGAE